MKLTTTSRSVWPPLVYRVVTSQDVIMVTSIIISKDGRRWHHWLVISPSADRESRLTRVIFVIENALRGQTMHARVVAFCKNIYVKILLRSYKSIEGCVAALFWKCWEYQTTGRYYFILLVGDRQKRQAQNS